DHAPGHVDAGDGAHATGAEATHAARSTTAEPRRDGDVGTSRKQLPILAAQREREPPHRAEVAPHVEPGLDVAEIAADGLERLLDVGGRVEAIAGAGPVVAEVEGDTLFEERDEVTISELEPQLFDARRLERGRDIEIVVEFETIPHENIEESKESTRQPR